MFLQKQFILNLYFLKPGLQRLSKLNEFFIFARGVDFAFGYDHDSVDGDANEYRDDEDY